ncbi:MAG TPA: hypothetical protein PKC43_01965 [Phycisphaerales bacterium]|nr:hypothetical protein [Phycisphaerales bacterium]HMP36191.1 hypothetical protein [Phycisphaerales bacterium]
MVAAIGVLIGCAGVALPSAAAWPESRLLAGWHLATGYPSQPPPPHLAPLLPRFYALLHGYLLLEGALDGNAKLPFSSWVVGHGIVDPAAVQAMVDLYAWYLATGGRR